MRLPSSNPHPALSAWATVLLSLWLIALWAGPLLLTALEAATGFALNPHGHTHLYAHGHPFVDARAWLGLPNTMDVLSNAPIALAGLWGLLVLRRKPSHGATLQAALVFFVGLLLTGFCSAWYHRAPDADGLVWDRLGMAVTFAGALSLAVAERVGALPARQTLWIALPLAVLSAVLPAANGNVLPWAVVQFGGMALIVWLALRRPAPGAIGIRLGVLIALYAMAKGLELGDAAVFQATAETVSGHSLKHLAAACAAWPVIAALSPRGSKAPAGLRQNAAGRAA